MAGIMSRTICNCPDVGTNSRLPPPPAVGETSNVHPDQKATWVVIAFFALALTACAPENNVFYSALPRLAPTHEARMGKVAGYGAIKFGMKREDVRQVLAQKAQELPVDPKDLPSLFFKEAQGAEVLDIWVHFDKKADSVSRIELTSATARDFIKTENECANAFKTYSDSFSKKYGEPDFPVKFRKTANGSKAMHYITFSDSSNIRVSYDFDSSKPQQCTVKVAYSTSWA